MSDDIVVRKARAGDTDAFLPDGFQPTVKAWVGERDGEPVIMGGVARGGDGRWYAFFDIKDEARSAKKLIVKSAKDFFKELDVPYAYAMVNEKEKNARKWMRSLGFELDPRSQILMRWKRGS